MSSNIVCASGDEKLDAAVNGWLKLDKNEETIKEVLEDVKDKNWNKLRKTMLNRQKFGTAGLRGHMAAGYNCINDVVILQTAQGLCSYLKKQSSQDKLEKGVVIGYDGRYNSKRFAMLTAKVFQSSNIPVHMFADVCPTPLVAFATRHIGVAAGVMVTASHNPKEDNGYKVYWSNGSQIISPHDDNLLEEISQCLEIPNDRWDLSDVMKNVFNCNNSIIAYMASIRDSLHEDVLKDNQNAAIDVVYSAMHGVGYDCINKAFEAANLKPVISVKEQQDPDPKFSTVVFPNPEEVECLVLSKALAEEKGIRLVLVNDPDADRLAVAEYDQSKKEWKTFSGNEMGALLGWWLLRHYYMKYPEADSGDVYVITSIVSSSMLKLIARGRAHFVQTLTGFKWMGNTALLLQQQGKVPVFAFEEAIGYMCHPEVPDKDGVSAAVHAASLASLLYSNGSSLTKMLDNLYQKHGYHLTQNSYFICDDQTIVQQIFREIRNYDGPGKYPKKIGSADIVYIHDLAAGVKISAHSCTNTHLNVVGTGLDCDYNCGEMIMFRNSDGLNVTVRTSGTEPKIKYYTELACGTAQHGELVEKYLKMGFAKMVQEFIDVLIQPDKHGLKGPNGDKE